MEEKVLEKKDEEPKDAGKNQSSVEISEKHSKNEPKKNSEKKNDKKSKKVSKKTESLSAEKDIEAQKMQYKKKRKKIIIISSLITLVLVIAIGISTVFSLFTLTNDKIMSGVSIEGIEMSGLSKKEAQAKLDLLYNEKKTKEIQVSYQEYETYLNPIAMEVDYKIEKAVTEAYLIGRKDNIFLSNFDVLFTLIWKKDINVDMALNEELTKQTIDGMSVNLPGVVLESSYSVEEDELIISKGKIGIIVDTDKMLAKVKNCLTNIHNNENFIEIPIKEKTPEPIDIDKIHAEICTEAKDAYYTKDPFVVYPEVNGISFDLETARALLAEEKEEYIVKLTITKPNVTLSQIGSEAFPDRLGTCTTRFDVSDVNRSTNLAIACRKINGLVLMPGEVFSYNKTLGERTAAAGYKIGTVYEAGQVVDGIGGGICQISSTLYNAILDANLTVVERRNHQFTTSYLEAGKDATVSYGAIDFKFKNTRKYPIKITASATAGIASVSIYGLKEEQEYTIKVTSKAIGSFPFSTKYIEDNTLPVGTEIVKQKGANGLKTETYITKILNGKTISTTLLSRDTYDAMQRIIIKGTQGASTPTQSPEPAPSVPEPMPTEPQPTEKPSADSNTDIETPTTSPESPVALDLTEPETN